MTVLGEDIMDNLFSAVRDGDLRMITKFLARNVQINDKDLHGRSALHYVVGGCHTEIVKLLLKLGACVNSIDRYCITPLHMASRKNDPEIVKLLLKSGANANIAAYTLLTENADEGYTPLHYAVESGSLVVTKLLLKYNADVNLKHRAELRYILPRNMVGRNLLSCF